MNPTTKPQTAQARRLIEYIDDVLNQLAGPPRPLTEAERIRHMAVCRGIRSLQAELEGLE